jgi:hypothetical protein
MPFLDRVRVTVKINVHRTKLALRTRSAMSREQNRETHTRIQTLELVDCSAIPRERRRYLLPLRKEFATSAETRWPDHSAWR